MTRKTLFLGHTYSWGKEQTKPITVFEAAQKGNVHSVHTDSIPAET